MPVPTHLSKSTSSSDKATQTSRKLVLCFDGTKDKFDDDVTNVIKLYSILAKDNVEEQLCYYQAGIGTYFSPGIVTPIFRWCAARVDEAIASYLYQHVMDGYKFLMQNYNVGDSVCLFGFSRGAYTARALAGMLHKVGLLSKDNTEQIPFAYTLYESGSDRHAEDYKKMFCRPVPIDFVGVWDTVASVGIVAGKTLPFVNDNTTIKVFRQALSLDERRAKFRPNLYHRNPTDKDKTSSDKQSTDEVRLLSETEVDEGENEPDFIEVWFSGCHSDVGGGNAKNGDIHALSNIPLRWMIEEIVRSKAPVTFDYDAFAQWHIPTNIGKRKRAATPKGGVPPITDQDALDVAQKLTDEIWKKPLWWLLEILPLKYMYENPTPGPKVKWEWETTRWPNCGSAREVAPGSLVHASVHHRKYDAKLGYRPMAHYKDEEVTYVI